MEVSTATAGASSSLTPRKRKKDRRIGRGHKKALVRWYSSRSSELDLLSLLTRYKHSHSWTNKDIFKLIHMKPTNEGIFYF